MNRHNDGESVVPFPSSHNHGSVENDCISNISFLSFRVVFHETMIMGERVKNKDLMHRNALPPVPTCFVPSVFQAGPTSELTLSEGFGKHVTWAWLTGKPGGFSVRDNKNTAKIYYRVLKRGVSKGRG